MTVQTFDVAGPYGALVRKTDYDALEIELADMEHERDMALSYLTVVQGERDALKARLVAASALISSQGIRLMEADDVAARLAEAVAVIKQVDGCSDGLCAKCQDALYAFLRATVSAQAIPGCTCKEAGVWDRVLTRTEVESVFTGGHVQGNSLCPAGDTIVTWTKSDSAPGEKP